MSWARPHGRVFSRQQNAVNLEPVATTLIGQAGRELRDTAFQPVHIPFLELILVTDSVEKTCPPNLPKAE
jgi:hypothetical protein